MGGFITCTRGQDEGVEATTTTEWGFVGEGRGQYIKVPTYVFVGEGNGEFEFEEEVVDGGYVHRAFCCCTAPPQGKGIPCLLALLLIALAIVGVASFVDQGSGDESHQKVQAKGITVAASSRRSHLQFSQHPELARPRYVCGADAGIDSASDAFDVFDTDHDGRVTVEELHDCAHGTSSRVQHASNRTRTRFADHCELQELARKLEDAHVTGKNQAPLRYDELVTALAKIAVEDIHSWSSAKRIWCCVHAGVACPSTSPASQGRVIALGPRFALPGEREPFDCSTGFNDWWRGWSQAKMDWCCTNYKRGCSATASLPPATTLPPC